MESSSEEDFDALVLRRIGEQGRIANEQQSWETQRYHAQERKREGITELLELAERIAAACRDYLAPDTSLTVIGFVNAQGKWWKRSRPSLVTLGAYTGWVAYKTATFHGGGEPRLSGGDSTSIIMHKAMITNNGELLAFRDHGHNRGHAIEVPSAPWEFARINEGDRELPSVFEGTSASVSTLREAFADFVAAKLNGRFRWH